MPSNLKPTTAHEREKWSNGEYSTGTGQIHEIILRLIEDVERLNTIRNVAQCVAECDLDVNDLAYWQPKLWEALNGKD